VLPTALIHCKRRGQQSLRRACQPHSVEVAAAGSHAPRPHPNHAKKANSTYARKSSAVSAHAKRGTVMRETRNIGPQLKRGRRRSGQTKGTASGWCHVRLPLGTHYACRRFRGTTDHIVFVVAVGERRARVQIVVVCGRVSAGRRHAALNADIVIVWAALPASK
jgi:hypothetical protein